MPVEEVLVEHRVVVGERLRQPAEPGGGDLLERRLVRLEPDAAHVQRDAVLAVHADKEGAGRVRGLVGVIGAPAKAGPASSPPPT